MKDLTRLHIKHQKIKHNWTRYITGEQVIIIDNICLSAIDNWVYLKINQYFYFLLFIYPSNHLSSSTPTPHHMES